jgi:hypothetical protein
LILVIVITIITNIHKRQCVNTRVLTITCTRTSCACTCTCTVCVSPIFISSNNDGNLDCVPALIGLRYIGHWANVNIFSFVYSFKDDVDVDVDGSMPNNFWTFPLWKLLLISTCLNFWIASLISSSRLSRSSRSSLSLLLLLSLSLSLEIIPFSFWKEGTGHAWSWRHGEDFVAPIL